MGTHSVMPGECLESIAHRYGFTDPHLIYDHPDNAALRRARPDPNVLLPGDEVVIPEREVKWFDAATEQRHRFVVRRRPVLLRMRMLDGAGKPRSGIPYRVEFQQTVLHGVTSANGIVEQPVPAWVPQARVTLDCEGAEERYDVALGYLDPVTHEEGLRQRLKALGYYVEAPGIPEDVRLRHAIYAYEHANDLPATGYPNSDLYEKLVEHYCS